MLFIQHVVYVYGFVNDFLHLLVYYLFLLLPVIITVNVAHAFVVFIEKEGALLTDEFVDFFEAVGADLAISKDVGNFTKNQLAVIAILAFDSLFIVSFLIFEFFYLLLIEDVLLNHIL